MNDKNTKIKIDEENARVICARLKENSESEANEITSRARKETEKVLTDAKSRASEDRQRILIGADTEIGQLKERMLSSAALEKKHALLEKKNDYVSSVLASVEAKATGLRQDSNRYADFLRRAILRGAAVLGVDEIEVLYSPADEKIFSQDFRSGISAAVISELGRQVNVKFTSGDFSETGVILRSVSGDRIYDGRITALIKQRREEFYMLLMRGNY